jgi:hypothetical protein
MPNPVYVVLAIALVVGFLVFSNRTWTKGNPWGRTNRPVCARCGSKKPVFRFKKPTLKEYLFGRWTCPNCGAHLDKNGQERAG